jgi:SOS-response transcriptional repressor LexA
MNDAGSNITDIHVSQGRCIPLVLLEEFNVNKDLGKVTPLRHTEVMTHYPCGEQARAFTLSDRSMEPRMNKGDIIVIDPDVEAVPGDFVVAKIVLEDSSDVIIFAQYSFTQNGTVLIAPANHQFKSYEFTQNEFSKAVEIIGVMTERTEPRRQ